MYELSGIERGNRILKIQKIAILSSLCTLVVLSLFTSTAFGITGNYSHDSSNSKNYVGVVVLFSDVGRHIPIGFCSGFLVSPTTLITAGHSLLNAEAVSVCFDKGPISYEVIDGKIVYYGVETIYNGDPELYIGNVPAKSGNQDFSTSDIGIIHLYNPVNGVILPKLPGKGFADTLPAKTNLQVMGYGFQYQLTPKSDGVMNTWGGTLSRNSAQSELSPANFHGSDKFLKLSANAAQNKGGISFGDSGGPVIYTDSNGDDFVLAVNAFVCNSNCAGVTYHTRIDTQEIITWITNNLAINC
jgi:hypothetical protein